MKVAIVSLSPLVWKYRPRKLLFSRARKRKAAIVSIGFAASWSLLAPLRVMAQTQPPPLVAGCKILVITGSVVDDDLKIKLARADVRGGSDGPAKWIVMRPHDLSADEYLSVTLCETK